MSISTHPGTLEKFTTFGDLLRFLRRRAGITQMELAIAVGYSDTQISRLEHNQRPPDIPTIEARFVSALGLENEPKVIAHLLDLAANVRREDAPGLGLCPYKGLSYFDEADADLFVGREELTAKLAERVLSLASNEAPDQTRCLAVVGASGSGKSSLVRAGLVPALRWNKKSADWHIHIFTPTAHPLESLAANLTLEDPSVTTTATLMDDFAQDIRSLQIFAKRKLQQENNARLLLIIDQFEELFALCRSEEERISFIDNLLKAVSEAGSPVIVIITLRADFYAHCAKYVQLREALAKNQEYIGAMNSKELRRAIEEPAKRGHWEIEPGLVDVLLHDVGQEPGALPLLSHALMETWQRRRGRTMTLGGYASSGGVHGAIAETAETVFTDQLTKEQQSIARRIFLRLTELNDETSATDTRRRAQFDELILKPEEAASTQAVLKALADARLIITSEDTAEVAHEALIREWPTLRGWLEENRDGLRLQRQLTETAKEWLEMERTPDMLYRGLRLDQAREWASTHGDELNLLEREFLTASIEAREHEIAEKEAQRQRELESAKELAETQRQAASRLRIRNRVITTVGSIAFILALLAGMFGFQSNRNARQAQANFANAEAQRLAAAANSLLKTGGNPEVIALLSLRSMNTQYTTQGDAALVAAAQLDLPVQLFSQASQVSTVAISPDGMYALTGGTDGIIRLWDVRSGEEIRQFLGHTGSISGSIFSPDGKRILTGSADKTARLWDLTTGKELHKFTGYNDVLTGVAYAPDGKTILTTSSDGTTRLWDSTTGQEIRIFTGYIAAFSPNGQYLVTVEENRVIRILNIQTEEEILQFTHDHASGLNSIRFSPDGKLILTSGRDGTAALWDSVNGKALQSFVGHTGSIVNAAFSPDGNYIFTASGDGTARLWNEQTGQELRRFISPAYVSSATVSPDGKYLLTGSNEGLARLWSVKARPELPSFATNLGFGAVAFSPDAKFILTGDFNGVASLWDFESGQKVREFIADTDIINYGVAFSPDGKYVLTGNWDGTVRLSDAYTGKEIRLFAGHNSRVNSVAISQDGKYIAAATYRDGAWLWDAGTGQEIRHFDSVAVLYRVAFSPDGKYLVTAGGKGDGSAHLWDISTGKLVQHFGGAFDSMSSVAFSPDGKYIVTGSSDNIARLWDVQLGKEVLQFIGHTDLVWSAIFSPDGNYVATASNDGTARLWDAQSGKELRRFIGHTAAVENLAFSPDGKYILTGGDDGTARLWDVDYHTTIEYLCSRLLRDFTEEEREQYSITDTMPTCPG
jgi:WD40 repeat protein/transcriptional regulator with XRE-family HTH domain